MRSLESQRPAEGSALDPQSVIRNSQLLFPPNWGKSYAHEKPPLWEWPQPPPPVALDWVPDEENMDMSFSGFGCPHSGLHFLHLNSYMGIMVPLLILF
jgi:hypothetical protein